MRKFTLRILLFVFMLAAFATESIAQSNVIANGGGPGVYQQNFDKMQPIAVATLPQGWKADKLTNPRTVGTYAAASTTTEFIEAANFHTNNSNGGIYNFGGGTTTIGNGDRAIGGLNTSSDPTSINDYLDLLVVGTNPITSVTLSYHLEKYRNQKNITTTVQLYYSTNGTTWTVVPAFAATFADDNNTDGFAFAPNASATKHVSGLVTFATPVAVGQHIYFAWNISPTSGNSASNSPAIGLDNVNVATTAAAPGGLFFRSIATGLWSAAGTWETSVDGNAPWIAATRGPDFNDFTITVRSGHVVTVAASVTTDETVVDAGGTITLNTAADELRVNDGVGFDIIVNGTVNGAGKLVIKSENTGSSNLGTATVGTSIGTVTAVATVERFISAISARSAWRLLTAPLRSSGTNTTIFNTWQNSGVYALGRGTTVTGPNYVGIGTNLAPVPAANGLDYLTPGPSVQWYNGTTLQPVTTTNTPGTTPLFTTAASAANNSYFIYINGDRAAFEGSPNTTTLTPSGLLQIGNQTFATSATPNAFNLVGNPYASHVSLDLFRIDNIAAGSNTKTNYYYWDPYLTGTYGRGAYVTVSYDALGNETITPAPVGSQDHTKFLQSGQAMFVQTNVTGAGTAALTFNENQKSPVTANNILRTQSAKIEGIGIGLNVFSSGAQILIDGIMAKFDNSYSAAVDDYDAAKMFNFGESISFMRNGTALSVERRPVITNNDVLYLNLTNLKAGRNYQFQVTPDLTTTGLTAFLVDNYLKTSTPIDLNKVTTFDFTINGDAASTGANRFNISFAKPGIVQAGEPGMSVFPNPVTNGYINLQMRNMPQGVYNVRVFNALGQAVVNKQINHTAGNSTQTIQIGRVKGVYQLEVVKPDNSKFSSKVIAN